jgi:hypothetical protein
MSGSLANIVITDDKVKAIQQYHALKELLYEIADLAQVDLTNINDLHRHISANVVLRNFLGDESYNKYAENFKTFPNQLN